MALRQAFDVADRLLAVDTVEVTIPLSNARRMSSAAGRIVQWRKCLNVWSSLKLRMPSYAVPSATQAKDASRFSGNVHSYSSRVAVMNRHLALDSEDLGEVANLSLRGTWAVLDLYEILHGLVEARPPSPHGVEVS